MRFVGKFDSETLKSLQIIAITQFSKNLLLDRPISVPALDPEFALHVLLKVRLNAVAIQQGVIHIHQENNWKVFVHVVVLNLATSIDQVRAYQSPVRRRSSGSQSAYRAASP